MGSRNIIEPLQSKIWQLDQDRSSTQGYLYSCSLCDEALLHESDDGSCGYYSRDLMCLSAVMRNRTVDENEAGDGACYSMGFVHPT